jgi:hypothetical protein
MARAGPAAATLFLRQRRIAVSTAGSGPAPATTGGQRLLVLPAHLLGTLDRDRPACR